MNEATKSSLSNRNESVKAFYDLLRDLSENFENVVSHYSDSDRERILQTMLDLAETFLTDFSFVDMEWNTMEEKIDLLVRTLKVVYSFMERVTGLCCADVEKGKRLFSIALSACYTLDLWVDTDTIPRDGIPTPTEVRVFAIKTAVSVLRNFGGPILVGMRKGESWKVLRTIIEDLVQTCHEIVEPLALLPEYPVSISPFKPPHLSTYEVEDPFSRRKTERDPSIIAVAANEGDRTRFLGLAVQVLTGIIYPALLSEWFISDLQQGIQAVARKVFDFCLSSDRYLSTGMRLRVVTDILNSLPFGSTAQLDEAFLLLPDKLLRWRLLKCASPEWKTIDQYLINYINSPHFILCETDFVELLRVLPRKRKGKKRQPRDLDNIKEAQEAALQEPDVLTVHYLCTCIPRVGAQTVQDFRLTIEDFYFGSQLGCIEEKINHRLSAEPVAIRGQLEPHTLWRAELQEIAQRLMAPETVDWMEDSDDSRYIQHAIDDIGSQFEQSLASTSLHARLLKIGQLQALVDLLHKCRPVELYSLSTLSACRSISSRFLEGSDNDVTPEVRRRVFRVVAGLVRFHALSPSEENLELVIRRLCLGMKHKDRSVRISAGGAFCAVAELLGASKFRVWGTLEDLFSILYGYIHDSVSLTVQETAIVVVGKLARSQNADIRGQALCFLIAQLKLTNTVLRGTAYLQISGCAQELGKKNAHDLLYPHFNKIAPFLVSNVCTHPALLIETCQLLETKRSIFVTFTLPRTLPPLFAECNDMVLHTVAKIVSVSSVSQLFLKHASKILAHIFVLPKENQVNKSLDYINQTIRKDAQDRQPGLTFDLEGVMKRYIVPVLAELVTEMGDTDDAVKRQAALGVGRVETLLARFTQKPGTSPSQSNLGLFLKVYSLGLITYLSDMLQDFYGKKPVDAKRKILRGIALMTESIGPSVTNIAPQIMAILQTMASVPELSEAAVESWRQFLVTLGSSEIGPYIGPTSATFVSSWSVFTPTAREIAKNVLDIIVARIDADSDEYLDNLADLSVLPELADTYNRLQRLRGNSTPQKLLERILERASTTNVTMATQSLRELRVFMYEHRIFVQEMASGDMFDPLVGQILTTLISSACRDAEEAEPVRLLAFECMGILGAVDPDRCDISYKDSAMIVKHNFNDEDEAISFVLHLITNLLVGAFRSTSDVRYQSHLAYIIQELLKFCRFSSALVGIGGPTSLPMKVRNRWHNLPKHVSDTVAPLLEGKFSLDKKVDTQLQYPFYPSQATYREWIQLWTTHLITIVSGPTARKIFGVFAVAVRNKDVSVARTILPHLILNILISGSEADTQMIRSEILLVLEDQVDSNSDSTPDKRLFSAQAVFMLLDHLNKWVRSIRQNILKEKDNTRSRSTTEFEDQLSRVDSILSSIDQDLMGNAALQCKSYARSLMSFETRVRDLREANPNHKDLTVYYERLHEVYAHLDEPDGMEGISTMILSPSLEHQIRHHETSGRWTSAQSCWEVKLQQDPDDVESHLGLLRCLRNLGHYDTLRTHVTGVLTRNPTWQNVLAGFQVESAWTVGAWDDVQKIVDSYDSQTPSMVIARILLAIKSKNAATVTKALAAARTVLGAPVAAAGIQGYRRSYDDVLNLHLTHELEIICNTISGSGLKSQPRSQRQSLTWKNRVLSARLEATLPTFRYREAILSMRRTAISLANMNANLTKAEIGVSWLASAKIARKAGQQQTAYTAMLQARESDAPFSFIESAKLLKTTGETLRALQQLENSMRHHGLLEDNNDANVLDLTLESEEATRLKAKVSSLRARWMHESRRFDVGVVYKAFDYSVQLDENWESGQFYLGRFQDENYKDLPPKDRTARGIKMNLFTVKAFAKAINSGSKFIYQTVPRLLTLWLDLGAVSETKGTDGFRKINKIVFETIKTAPVWKWYTAFPQIVSRLGHQNSDVVDVLCRLISKVIQEYPKQALWLFISTLKSTDPGRVKRGKGILDKLRNHPSLARSAVPRIINQMITFLHEMLALCNHSVPQEKKVLLLNKDVPGLKNLNRSELIIPLQESITANLPPPTSSDTSNHHPFPSSAPTFQQFLEEIQIMHSLARPRKISVCGSDGQIYVFLAKPKDDLRKDARLMDLYGIINKLLKTNSESRRRQLRIRTYGVVTLNEECGLIQWVPNTCPVRTILSKYYKDRGIPVWSDQINRTCIEIKPLKESTYDSRVVSLFKKHVLSSFPPVFHEWFLETFPEPSAWLHSRLNYGRTSAVMCMVGFILGLGDRHCENILMDENCGDMIHVDFNVLFDKGKTLETPEIVPFRLTHNLVDGLGVTGVEGVFRMTCEITFQLLRDNKASLASVLDAFIHDPLVEWDEEKRKLERTNNFQQQWVNREREKQPDAEIKLKLAKTSLSAIQRKLEGYYSTNSKKDSVSQERWSTINLVELLIQEATDLAHLARMYQGWAAWF
ncbi:hypothetical protein K435DRAFT_967914 [Dendrothele bispora CBS 962.96]|uniref:non-specific serine/threonine protein kinase n=1 Tax=Dendrothele bispora (strain CBS 962.96) TaxID=1314807 RepID=A0A4S8LRN3_DENBC|nr:hypothetical protein K435DRAFT_967914 [Dendrothele bispora CBS 962.96]